MEKDVIAASGWDKEETQRLFKEFAQSRNFQIKEKLILNYMNLVRYLASRFAKRGEALEDLIQVGSIGLLNAIERFDLNRGIEFTTFAIPTIVGELKRYFRDKSLFIRIPRRLQQLNYKLNQAVEELTSILLRSPRLEEIAKYLEVSEEEILEAQEMSNQYFPLSFSQGYNERDGKEETNLLELLGESDKRLENIEDLVILQKAFKVLSKRERLVLYLRFYENFSQAEIGKRLGISQMHVSRLEHKSLTKMKDFIISELKEKEEKLLGLEDSLS